MKHCRNIEEIQDTQKYALLQAINESKQNEICRNKQLMVAANKGRVKELKKRHELEREFEQEKIGNLVQDFEILNCGRISKELRASVAERNESVTRIRPILTMGKDRFSLSHLHRNYKAQEDKYRAVDKAAELKNRPRYDEYVEKKKLMLLNQKRDIIKGLVDIQSTNLNNFRRTQFVASRGQKVSSSFRIIQSTVNKQPSLCRQSENSYDSSSTRPSTTASWATFASAGHTTLPAPRKFANIPVLQLHG